MSKIVTLGEIMLRLSPPGHLRFVQSNSFDIVYGGGEANVAVSCANYGHEAYFVTKLPAHEIGQSALNALRQYGVKTDFICRGGIPSTHTRHGLWRSQGWHQQLHGLYGKRGGYQVHPGHPRQRHRTGLLPYQPEPCIAH